MPFLFPDEKVGYKDGPGQPWEGIGPDYYEFTPLIARRLHPFPDSPLRSKCPDMPPHELALPLKRRYKPPVPKIDRSYVSFLTTRQVLVEHTYEYDKEMETHVMMVQYLIRPVDMIPSNFHTSPRFVCSFWNINCGAKPQWVVDDAASVSVTHVVKDLESRVRVCAAYAKRLMNLAVPQSVESTTDVLWPAMTPPRKTGGGGSTRARADRISRKPYM
ncbi:hypothetical protein C8J57DRAFT_1460457 [Mycena rebaudengoi]|nr:hypothetical protein C8J57DRAFT_1460457 [Mycena rebaudengoi]